MVGSITKHLKSADEIELEAKYESEMVLINAGIAFHIKSEYDNWLMEDIVKSFIAGIKYSKSTHLPLDEVEKIIYKVLDRASNAVMLPAHKQRVLSVKFDDLLPFHELK